MISEQYSTIQKAKDVPYYEETQKRTFKQKLHKIHNTICFLLAYACPNNSLRKWLHRRRGVHIGKNVYIGMFVFFDNLYPDYIYIEDNASINAGSMILTHFNPMKRYQFLFQASVQPVLIKEGAIVAVKSVVMPGVTVGTSSVVSAGTVVDKDVPDYSLAKGNPMKIVLEFSDLVQNPT